MMEPLGRSTTLGTREHALRVTEGRHPGVRDALQWLTFEHLPQALQDYSRPFYQTAVELIRTILTDSPELTTSLNKLIEAKDSAVRAGIKDSTGRAGAVPRPQEVVKPPLFTDDGSQATDPRLAGQLRPIADNPQA
jgi:hypothetical protein